MAVKALASGNGVGGSNERASAARATRRNEDMHGSKFMSLNIETPLMHSRRLPVSVRGRGGVTLLACLVLWSERSRAIGPIVSLMYSGALVVMARCTAQVV